MFFWVQRKGKCFLPGRRRMVGDLQKKLTLFLWKEYHNIYQHVTINNINLFIFTRTHDFLIIQSYIQPTNTHWNNECRFPVHCEVLSPSNSIPCPSSILNRPQVLIYRLVSKGPKSCNLIRIFIKTGQLSRLWIARLTCLHVSKRHFHSTLLQSIRLYVL
jgi:hypothetical protein